MASHLRCRKDNPQTPAVVLVLQLHLCCRYGSLLGTCGRGAASMSVAVWSGSLVAWERELVALKERIGPVFGRAVRGRHAALHVPVPSTPPLLVCCIAA